MNRDEAQLRRWRDYLSVLTRIQLASGLHGKVDLSGVVQQTLLEAFQQAVPAPADPAQQAAWLRRILANNLADALRKYGARARDVALERSLQASLEESAARLESWLASEESSPPERAMRNEQLLRLAEALDRLPDDQRVAVEMHHLQGRPLAEVAGVLGRSKGAVATLLFRGMTRLRNDLAAGAKE